jgi:5,10-methylenetetrahydrofolate reductase
MTLKQSLSEKSFVVTSEIQAPIGEEPGALIKKLESIGGRMNGLAVPDVGIEGVVANTISTCKLLKESGVEAIYEIVTREKNRLEIQKDLIRAHKSGIESILVFTEDYRITGDSLQEIMFFHVDSGKLSSVLEHLQEGYTVNGKELPFKAEFTFGSGVESKWGKNVPELEMKEMEEMTKKGAGYFLTTPVFDIGLFEKFMKQVSTFGVPVIAEVIILSTVGIAQFLNSHLKSGLVPAWMIKKLSKASDRQKASIEIFTEITSGLKDLCQGVHIISLSAEDRLKYYLDAARLKKF